LMPKFDKRTKAGKQGYADFMALNEGKTHLDIKQYESMKGMMKSIQSSSSVQAAMKMGVPELSVFGKMGGVMCRCRPDWVDTNRGIMFDLKTSRDASESSFVKSAFNFGYHRQAAFYLDLFYEVTGQRLRSYGYIVVENLPPFALNMFSLFGDFYGIGRSTYEPLMEVYKRATEGECIGYGDNFKDLIPKAWMFYEAEEMDGGNNE